MIKFLTSLMPEDPTRRTKEAVSHHPGHPGAELGKERANDYKKDRHPASFCPLLMKFLGKIQK